eukprot:SAG11_NODE_13870_length_635_cov_1.160448_1_plen_58_part_10
MLEEHTQAVNGQERVGPHHHPQSVCRSPRTAPSAAPRETFLELSTVRHDSQSGVKLCT